MTLVPGARLGAYEIAAPIGAGGMGEVYKARDTRLNRTVAIKILPQHTPTSHEARERFEHEAQVIAGFKHPHICVLYDVGRQDDIDYLVLEYLEGITLAERLAKGPLSLSEAVQIALQIADALDKAHQTGVVHRDLKPANIMLTTEGAARQGPPQAKLLDFGLAKLRAEGTAAPAFADAPTRGALTGVGMIVGTPQYMAPEQLDGAEADARTDIFAFGAVLYEMITGRRAFEGKSQSTLIAAIVSSEPVPASRVCAGVPPLLDHVIARCLAKNPSDRWQSARDLLLELKWAAEAPLPASSVTGAAKSGSRRALTMTAALLAAGLVAAIVPAVLYFRSPAPSSPDVRFEIPVQTMPEPYAIAISPDGRRVAYAAAAESGNEAVWVRPLDALQARLLPGTETSTSDAVYPFWSPDGRYVGFASSGDLKKVDVGGGAPQTLATLGGQFGGGAWNRDGVIIFASNNHGLRRVSSSGGDVSDVSTRDNTLGETYHDCPVFLPDGHHFLYLAWSASKPENRAIYIGTLDSTSRTRLMTAESNAVYAPPGYLLFLRGGTLMARPFDADRLAFTGDASPVVERVATDIGGEIGAFAASESGALIYRTTAGEASNRQLVWIDRAGKSGPASTAKFQTGLLRLSPDDKQVAFSEGGPSDIWVYDFARDVRMKLTTDPSIDHNPVWSPDGSRLLFDSHRGSSGATSGSVAAARLFEKPSNGATPERQFLDEEPGVSHSPKDWSRDGRFVVLSKANLSGDGQWNLWVLPLTGDRKPFPYRVGTFNENEAALAPNGRWLAFTSNESGTNQVIVQPFPDPSGGRWQISTNGGSYPRWRADGRELFYLDSASRIVAASVTTDTRFEIQESKPLFKTPVAVQIAVGGAVFPYDVTSDGKRFLMSIPLTPNAAVPISVLLNWRGMLKP